MNGKKAKALRKKTTEIIRNRTDLKTVLVWARHRNSDEDKAPFLQWFGWPRIYRNLKRRYKAGQLAV